MTQIPKFCTINKAQARNSRICLVMLLVRASLQETVRNPGDRQRYLNLGYDQQLQRGEGSRAAIDMNYKQRHALPLHVLLWHVLVGIGF